MELISLKVIYWVMRFVFEIQSRKIEFVGNGKKQIEMERLTSSSTYVKT